MAVGRGRWKLPAGDRREESRFRGYRKGWEEERAVGCRPGGCGGRGASYSTPIPRTLGCRMPCKPWRGARCCPRAILVMAQDVVRQLAGLMLP